MAEPILPLDLDAIEEEMDLARVDWTMTAETLALRKYLAAAFSEIRARREADEVALAFLCPICAHAGVDEDQCCSSLRRGQLRRREGGRRGHRAAAEEPGQS